MTMIEKVKRALEAIDLDVAQHGGFVSYEAKARIAIEAMREPSEKLIDVAIVKYLTKIRYEDTPSAMREAWQAMIDEVLKETP